MQVPEWDFFKRIENLEGKIKEIEGQVSPDTLFPIAWVGIIYAFIALSLHSPKSARKCKDIILSTLGGVGVNKRALDVFEEKILIPMVEQFEKLN